MTVNLKNSLLVSLAAHVVILGIFFLIHVHPAVRVPQEVEIAFVGPAPQQTAARVKITSPSVQSEPQELAPTPPARANKTQTAVALPKRRMQEEEEPLLPIRPEKKVSAQELPPTIPEEKPAETPPTQIPGLPPKGHD